MILGRVGRCRKLLLVVVTSEKNINLINFVEVKRLANLPPTTGTRSSVVVVSQALPLN